MTFFPHKRRIVAGCAVVLALVVLDGCGGGGKKTFSLTGKVTYKGNPVTGGTLTLTPSDGKTPPVNIQINPDGAYAVVPPSVGEMKVAIETESIRGQTGGGYAYVPPGIQKPDIDASQLPRYVRIPRKYANAQWSKLTVTIQKGKNVHDFDLTD